MSLRTGLMMVGACALLVGGAFVIAGPLDPPAGPVASTGVTLSEINDAVNGIGGGSSIEPLDRAVYADTSAVPGSVTDGKPLTTLDLLTSTCRLEVSGIGTIDFDIAEVTRTIVPLEFDTGDGVISTPGPVGYEVSLIRTLPRTPDVLLEQWFDDLRTTMTTGNDAVLTLRDARDDVIRTYNLISTFPTAIDLRSANGILVEQVTLSVDRIDLVPMN